MVLIAVLVVIPAFGSVSHAFDMSKPQQKSLQGSELLHSDLKALSRQGSTSHPVTTMKDNTSKEKSVKLTNFVPVKSFKESATSLSVNPQALYKSEPAPMGIADYGLSTNGISGYNSYSYSTPSFLGKVNITSLSTNNTTSSSVGSQMSFQMNVNLEFYNAGIEYDYWIQDVAFLQTGSPHSILFIDNVWNYSSDTANMHNSSISGNGTVAKSGSFQYYYAVAGNTLPGNNINIVFPMEFQLKVISEINSQGNPEVAFLYNDGYGWVTYDNPSFIFANNLTSDLGFTVNGTEYNPYGAYYDSELIMGGPGGGSDTTDVSSNLSLMLQYWNGQNYQQISNAFNHGSDTAEGISNVISSAKYFTNTGSVFARETPGSSSLGQMYNYTEIGILNLSTTIKSGILSVGGDRHDFQNYGANLTLGPGNYSLVIYNSSNPEIPVWDSSVNISAGSYTSLSAYGFYAVTFSESGLPKGTVWFVNITGRSSSGKITSGNYTVYLPNGTYYYNISTTLKTYSPSYHGSVIISGSALTQHIKFSELRYSIEFGQTGLPGGTMWNISSTSGISNTSSGRNLTLYVTNGTYNLYVSTIDTYYPLQAEYNVTVSGSNLTETLIFMPYSYIHGSVNPSGSLVEINGKALNVTDGKFNLKVRNGSYYIVASMDSYNTYYGNISLDSGSNYYINITLTQSVISQTAKEKPSSADLYYMGSLVAIIVAFAFVGLIARRKR